MIPKKIIMLVSDTPCDPAISLARILSHSTVLNSVSIQFCIIILHIITNRETVDQLQGVMVLELELLRFVLCSGELLLQLLEMALPVDIDVGSLPLILRGFILVIIFY